MSKYDNLSAAQNTMMEELKCFEKELDGELQMHDPSSPPPVWNALLHTASPLLKAPAPLCRVLCGSRHDVVKCARFAVANRLPLVARGETGCHQTEYPRCVHM